MASRRSVKVAELHSPLASEGRLEAHDDRAGALRHRCRLAERIEVIEQAYELMLAYAAQGRQNDTDDSSSIRRFLQRADAALDGLAACLRQSVAARAEAYADFIAVARAGCATHARGISPGAGAAGAEFAADRQSERLDPYPRAADRYLPDRRDAEGRRERWLTQHGPGWA